MSAWNRSCIRWSSKILRVCGSLVVAIILMTFLAVAMGWATFLEREMGTPVAQQIVYASNWFYLAIGLLGVNILCSALIRLPRLARVEQDAESGRRRVRIERRLVPFFFAHVGVLLLLVGCWTTARHSSKARIIASEGTAVEKAIDVDSRLIKIELTDLAPTDSGEIPQKTIEFPFSGGTLNWRDYESAKNWQNDVAKPLLDKKPDGKFFQKLAKNASTLSQRAAYRAAKIARKTGLGVLYSVDGLKLEALDYATCADYAPASPCEIELETRDASGKTERRKVEIAFSFDGTPVDDDPLAASRRAQRKTLDDGLRVVYALADSNAEAAAFVAAVPQNVDSDRVVLVLDGIRYELALDDLTNLARYGSLDDQKLSLQIQQEEIERRLAQERAREDADDESAKPLQTVSRDDLVAKDKELRELSAKLVQGADDATNPNGEPGEGVDQYVEARRAYEQTRVLNYLATTWSQLENSTPTSKEFCATLETMKEQIDKSRTEVAELDEKTKLGDSGWKIVAFQSSPTLLQGIEELQGWSCVVQMRTPQGESCELTLFSELAERNRNPENGRAFGALWVKRAKGTDTEYGREWNDALDKPRLELMQTRDSRLFYRYADGSNRAVSGEFALSPLDAEKGTFKGERVAFDVKADAETPQILAAAPTSFVFQDEFGARVQLGKFQKDHANEFYGQLKIRATLDETSETFWLRTIPLESVTEEQIAYMTKTIASKTRRATIRLSDKEVALGAALFVKRFVPVYEPGSSTAASFSSLTRVLPAGLSRGEQIEKAFDENGEDVLIQMNRPGTLKEPNSGKTYWAYQDSFRGPFKPGDNEFDSVVQGGLLPGETKPRDVLYQTIVTLNDDPGRGMKYLACLFIVWGTILLVYRRPKRADAVKIEGESLKDASKATSENGEQQLTSTKTTTALKAIIVCAIALTASNARADLLPPPQREIGAENQQVISKTEVEASGVSSEEPKVETSEEGASQESSASESKNRSEERELNLRMKAMTVGIVLLACVFCYLLWKRAKKLKTRGLASASEEWRVDAPKSDAAKTLAILAAFVALGANEVRADVVAPESKAAPRSQAIDWTPWSSLPIFDSGRKAPLEAYAEIFARETTGSKNPKFAVPNSLVEELEGDKPLHFPSFDDFIKDLEKDERHTNKDSKITDELRAQYRERYDEVVAKTVERQHKVAARLRGLFPGGVRQFSAKELLFTMLIEPEVWEYVPFIDDPKGAVAKDVLNLTDKERLERAYRLSPADLDALAKGGTTQTAVDVFRARAKADSTGAFQPTLKALDKVEERLGGFRGLTFAPTRGVSSKVFSYMNKILYGETPSMGMGAFHASKPSPLARLDSASQNIERMLRGEKKDDRKASPFNDKEYLLRQRTPVSGDAKGRDALTLARQIAVLAGSFEQFPLSSTGYLFERLVATTSATLADLKKHRDDAISSGRYTVQYRQELQRAVAAFEELEENLELAYLALTTESTKTLFLSPVARPNLSATSEERVSPWNSIQEILWAPDDAYLRFVDPQATIKPEQAEKKEDDASKGMSKDAVEILPTDDFLTALGKTATNSRYERNVAQALINAAESYQNGGNDFNANLQIFADALREQAERADARRAELAQNDFDDDQAREEYLAKTSYPVHGALDAEVFYYKLNAFYWNWVACLLAVVAFILSYIRQLLRKKTPEGSARREDRLFFAIGLGFLTASCVVAFLGGAVRAYITGWAPVANMFETVVLLAFLIAAIAIGYALAPAWTRVYTNAWRATAFPWLLGKEEDKRVAKIMAIPRILAIAACFYVAYGIWRSGRPDGTSDLQALVQTLKSAFAMQGALDSLAVAATFWFVAWSVPRFVVALLALAIFPKTLGTRTDLEELGAKTKEEKRALILEQIVQRKAFLTCSSIVACLVAAAAYFNSTEFNPNIRPLVAVLRSNFWLTIHVIAIIVSYALGAIAWVVAITSLSSYIFGRYGRPTAGAANAAASQPTLSRRERRANAKRAKKEPKTNAIPVANQPSEPIEFDPPYARKIAPVVAIMMRASVIFLTAGIILGARWADFSWGRFWSWDPKEVWALVTLLIYLVVLHARKIGGNQRFILALGANFGALAIIMTWYGLSFVMGGGGRHAYVSGESNKIVALYLLFGANLLWTFLALARYWFEKIRAKGNQ